MDISNEATVDSFSIGPSTIIGRTIAFRILFCNSTAELKQKIIGFLRIWLTKFRKSARPFVSWLHPRNPQAILSIVILIAFLLKRNSNGKSTAQSGDRRKLWANLMRNACTYDEWVHAAKMLDIETPEVSELNLYDEELVRNKLHELSQRRQEGSLREIMFHMRADLLRNLGNMCNPHLHQGRYQVPRLINRYIDEVSTQLRMVCYSESNELLLEEKLTFMHETRHAFGRTALLLSGGASLGSFHAGVVKTLVEHKLLPQIIAGSSVGSIMCSIVATRSSPELQSFFENSLHSLKFFDQIGGIFTVVRRIITLGAVHEIRQLQNMLRDLTSNLTFQEAYDLTGQILGITVSSMREHEPPRCLNYLTSPHVVIWSAVTASCAFPGLFEAQELMAKDRNGELVPYHAAFEIDPGEASGYAARRWRDGSLESDLPMMHLKELFNVNHFIVSQANPHITPLLRFKELIRSYGGDFAAKLAHLAEMEVKHRFDQMLELGFPLGGLAKLFSQDWEGDVTIVMPTTLAQYSKLLQNPSRTELQKAENQGRKCTWEKLSAIKANCGIEHALDECVSYLNHLQRLKRGTKRASASRGLSFTTKSGAWRRIPSWNCLARENSWGSLDDEALVDVGFNQGGRVNRNMVFNHSNIHDGSDSETESIDINISWTRSGGPLMRTGSATTFVNFIKNVNIDDEEPTNRSVCDGTLPHLNTDWPEILDKDSGQNNRDSGNKVPATASSIVVSEGDLLQPERTHNGFVLNVVKKEGLALASKRCDPEKYQGSSEHIAERVQLDNLGKEMESYNVSSPPAYGDEDDGISGEHFDEMGCKNLFF